VPDCRIDDEGAVPTFAAVMSPIASKIHHSGRDIPN
jgi:hypothetical protein